MKLKESLKNLELSEEFRSWKQKHSSAFLAHAFMMLDEPNKEAVQLGFYDKESDRITTFIVEPEKISLLPESEVFKSGQSIKPLEMDEVKLEVEKAMEIAEKYKKENHAGEFSIKTFFIVQCLDDKCVFNVTFFTRSMKTLNIKIDVADGKILKHSFEPLVSGSQ